MANGGKGISGVLSTWRARLGYVFWFGGRLVHFGYVPYIIYLGFSLGQTDPAGPELSLRSLIWQ